MVFFRNQLMVFFRNRMLFFRNLSPTWYFSATRVCLQPGGGRKGSEGGVKAEWSSRNQMVFFRNRMVLFRNRMVSVRHQCFQQAGGWGKGHGSRAKVLFRNRIVFVRNLIWCFSATRGMGGPERVTWTVLFSQPDGVFPQPGDVFPQPAFPQPGG